jgi:hypothetical protein
MFEGVVVIRGDELMAARKMPIVPDTISAIFQLGVHCSSLRPARPTCEPTSDIGGVAKTVRRYQEFLLVTPRRKRRRLFEFCGRDLP